MSSKPLKPIDMKLGKDYIVKKINKKNKYSFTLDDIHNYIRSETTKTVTSYTFFDFMGNLTNDEQNISNIDNENYNKINLKYDEDLDKWYNYDKKYYYIFECPCQTQEENLTRVKPASIKNSKTYLISSCLQRFYVELVDVKEKTYFNELEVNDEINVNEDEIYSLKLFRFKLTDNSKNKDYVKQGEDDLTLVAYETENGTYKWKKYNIYKIFVPRAAQINQHVLGNISFKPKKSSESSESQKTKKKSPKFLPNELSDLVFSFVGEKKDGRKRTRKNNR